MDEADAKYVLKLVAEKVVTRAAKRKAEAEALAIIEEARKEAIGAARAAKRAAIHARMPPTRMYVGYDLRVHRY